jgi:tetratricopeptide (TPR) repeat protein
VELAEGFWLGFLFSVSPRSTEVLSRRMEVLLRGQVRNFFRLQPRTPAELREVLAFLLSPEAATAGCIWVEALNLDPGEGSERPWEKTWLDLIVRMNERRDALRRHLHGGLVLAAAPPMKSLFRELASDLWSIRALVVELPAAPPARQTLPTAPLHSWTKSPTRDDSLPPVDASFLLSDSARILKHASEDDPGIVDVLLRKSRALSWTDKTGEAIETARRARELARKHARKSPLLEANALHELAVAEAAHGDAAAAIEHFEEALHLIGDSHQPLRINLLYALARLAYERQETEIARGAFEKLLDLRRSQRASLGDNPQTLRNLSFALNWMGRVLQDQGNLSAAFASFEESVSLCRQLRASLSDNPQTLRDLSIALNSMGHVLLDQGNLSAASASFEESVSLCRQLRASLGDNPQTLRDLSSALNWLGRGALAMRDMTAAFSSFEEALDLGHRLRSLTGDTHDIRNLLSRILERQGDAHLADGRLPATLAAYDEALVLRRQWQASLGDTPETLCGLITLLLKTSRAHLSLGELAAATTDFGEAATLCRQWRAAFPEHCEALSDVIQLLHALETSQANASEPDAATKLRAAALEFRKFVESSVPPGAQVRVPSPSSEL